MASYFNQNRKQTLDSGSDILAQINLYGIYFYFFGDGGCILWSMCRYQKMDFKGQFSSSTI